LLFEECIVQDISYFDISTLQRGLAWGRLQDVKRPMTPGLTRIWSELGTGLGRWAKGGAVEGLGHWTNDVLPPNPVERMSVLSLSRGG